MTEGTSKGLYMVVAIIIFGIFVTLSYSLFNTSLQPQIENLFEQSLEQGIQNTTRDSVSDNKDKPNTVHTYKKDRYSLDFEFNILGIFLKRLIYLVSIVIFGVFMIYIYKLNKNKHEELDFNNRMLAIKERNSAKDYMYDKPLNIDNSEFILLGSNFNLDEHYTISFDLTLEEGFIYSLGGHLKLSNEPIIKVDGVEIKEQENNDDLINTWHKGFKLDDSFNDGVTKHIEVSFKVDYFDESLKEFNHFSVKPNRCSKDELNLKETPLYKVSLNNIKLVKDTITDDLKV